MFICIECYDLETKVKYKAYVNVENIVSIEPECFVDLQDPYYDDTCSCIYLNSDCILHSYSPPRQLVDYISVEQKVVS